MRIYQDNILYQKIEKKILIKKIYDPDRNIKKIYDTDEKVPIALIRDDYKIEEDMENMLNSYQKKQEY